jgi:hypothetical protein
MGLRTPADAKAETEEPQEATPAPPVQAENVAAVLQLQRTCGNAAVSRLMARTPAASRAAIAATGHNVLARDPRTAAPDAPSPAGTERSVPAPDLLDPELLLTPQDRAVIVGETQMEIGTAFTAFTDACIANITAMKAAAKADAEMFALVLDIATGFAAPAFANWATAKWVAKLNSSAAASMAKDTAAAAAKAEPAKLLGVISHSDALKAKFTGVSKVAGDQIKRNATALFGESDEDVLLDHLKSRFQAGAVTLAGRVADPKLSEAELLSIWIAYDPSVADVFAYKAQVKALLDQYQQFVKPIMETTLPGERAMGDYMSSTIGIRAYAIDAYGQNRVVLLDQSEAANTKTFRAWVPAKWQDMAIERTKKVFGGYSSIKGEQIDGHLPAP